MTNPLDNLDEQIRLLQEQREKLILLKSQECSITAGTTSNGSEAYLRLSNTQNTEVNNVLRSFGWNDYYKARVIPFNLFESICDALAKISNVVMSPTVELTKESVRIKLNAPDVLIDYKEPNLTIKFNAWSGLHKWVFFNNELEAVSREDYIRQYYTLPLSVADEVVTRVDLHKAQWKIEISELAKTAIEEEIRKNAVIDDVALLKDYPAGDVVFFDPSLKLRPFQKVTTKFAELANDRFLIGDEMGLGKTWQLIARAMKLNARTLFIVPPNLIPNWMRELKRLTGKEPLVFKGREPSTLSVMELVVHKSHQFNLVGWSSLSTVFETEQKDGMDVTSVAPWVNYINLSQFDLICLDEVHRGKNADSSRSKAMLQIKAPKIIGASGTPVINRPSEYFNFLHLIAPQTFKSRTDYLSRYTDGKNGVRNVKELRKLLRPLMIRRTKKDVMKELPPIERIQDLLALNDEQRAEYQKILAGIVEYINAEGFNIQQEIHNVLTLILRLKEYLANVACVRSVDLAMELYDNAVENEHPHKKVIIFSQFRATCKAISKLLGHEALWFDGTVDIEKRMETVDEFISDERYKYLCVTTKSASEGLNITIAGSVIFNDLMWTPADHSQAEARAYGRLNDAHGVDSYYIIAQDTIMQWIWELLEGKLKVIEEVVDGVQSSRVGESIAMTIIQRLKGL